MTRRNCAPHDRWYYGPMTGSSRAADSADPPRRKKYDTPCGDTLFRWGLLLFIVGCVLSFGLGGVPYVLHGIHPGHTGGTMLMMNISVWSIPVSLLMMAYGLLLWKKLGLMLAALGGAGTIIFGCAFFLGGGMPYLLSSRLPTGQYPSLALASVYLLPVSLAIFVGSPLLFVFWDTRD
ncbi:MAG: hypothetical protein PHI63_06210 [Patescibacteria group bacterium]|nr:hypothetical protein [Patescibacteria group bacterium]